MAYQLKYDSRFAGAKAVATQNGAQATTGIVNFGTVYVFGASDYAICTGYYYDTDGMTIYVQTDSGMYLIVDLNSPEWSFTTDVVRPKTYTQTQAQYLVNKIIRNNDQILKNNLVCARYANIFTNAQKQQIRELQERLQERNKALQAEGLLTSVQTSSPEGYAELAPYLDKLMSGGGIGLATWAVVVIAATVVAATATAAYFAYKSFADESEQDVKFSKELTAILAEKLTPEEYEQLLNETKGIVTKARIKQAVSSYGTVFMIAGAAVGGFLLYKFLKEYM